MGTASTNPQESQSMVKFPGPQAARVMTETSGSYSQPSNFAAFEDLAERREPSERRNWEQRTADSNGEPTNGESQPDPQPRPTAITTRPTAQTDADHNQTHSPDRRRSQLDPRRSQPRR